jgi:periplasmic divalent cation tolerance protein
MGIVLVSTYPDKKSISQVANIVVQRNLAACVNFTKITSVYAWKGKIENNREFLALFKTTRRAKQKLWDEIERSHPYKVPEIIEIKMDYIGIPYMKWLEESTRGRKPKKRNNTTKR